MNFEQFQERSTRGALEAVYVTYTATYAVVGGEEIGTCTVTGERDELTDFASAVTDEAVLPILEDLEPHLSEQHGVDIEVVQMEVKHIVTRVDNADLSSTFIAYTTDGRTLVFNRTAQENFEDLLASILGE
jgi:hypothetical protein